MFATADPAAAVVPRKPINMIWPATTSSGTSGAVVVGANVVVEADEVDGDAVVDEVDAVSSFDPHAAVTASADAPSKNWRRPKVTRPSVAARAGEARSRHPALRRRRSEARMRRSPCAPR